MNFDHLLETLASPALRAVARHWNEARGNAPMPSWEQLNPARMAPHLSIVWAYKYEPSIGQFVGRLAGDSVAWNASTSFRGITVRQLWSAKTAALVHDKMYRIISESAICLMRGTLFQHGDRLIEGERIALPLAGDGLRGDGVLGASIYKNLIRNAEMGDIELLPGDEAWFPITGGNAHAGEMAQAAVG